MSDKSEIEQLKLDAVLWFGPAVTLFEQIYSSKDGEMFVSTDIETDEYIVIIADRTENLSERLQRISFINQQLYSNQKTILCVVTDESFKSEDQDSVTFFSTLNEMFDYVVNHHLK